MLLSVIVTASPVQDFYVQVYQKLNYTNYVALASYLYSYLAKGRIRCAHTKKKEILVQWT